MNGHEIAATRGEELVAFVRALGKHRYVAGRLHLVHAFAVEAASPHPDLAAAEAWARETLADDAIDRASKDERLYRRASDAEIVAVFEAFWAPGEARTRARDRLAARLSQIEVEVEPARLPFDEDAEEDVFPVLVDAGWELLPLAELDPERHKGAMNAFGDQLAWEVARFEEENAIPALVHLHELPAIGPVELLFATDEEGSVRAPFVLWTSGDETYQDYVMRGVTKVAGLARSS